MKYIGKDNVIRLAIHYILLTKVKKNIHMNYNLLIKFLDFPIF